MAVANNVAPLPFTPTYDTMTADTNMDVDMDFEVDPEIARLQAEAAAFDAVCLRTGANESHSANDEQQPNGAAGTEAMNGVEEAAEEGEVDANAPERTKVHIRGVDSFAPRDVRNFAGEHYALDQFQRMQWVDDTSLNLVYATEAAAEEALQALSAEEMVDPLQLRAAKRLSTHPDVELFVRQAVASDVKIQNARVNSAFYLNNPQYDPETRFQDGRKRRFDDGRRYRNRDYDNDYKRRRMDVGDEMYSRRGSKDEPFNVDLYDDAPAAKPARMERKDSYSSGSEYGRKRVRYEDDLMPGKEDGRLRNRSASPMRDGDGRFGFSDNQPRRRTARPRSPTPPRIRAGRDNRAARDNIRKELFPEKKATNGTAFMNGHTNGNTIELFPNLSSPPKAPRELLHRRQDAHDLDREYSQKHRDVVEVTKNFGRCNFDGADEYQDAYAYSDRPPRRSRKENEQPRDLFSRIDGGATAKMDSSYGRLRDRPRSSRGDDEAGFSFKGAGNGGSGGFSILGASRDRAENPLVKELFPLKAGGGGSGGKKDLFDGRIKGRGSQRDRAEDLF